MVRKIAADLKLIRICCLLPFFKGRCIRNLVQFEKLRKLINIIFAITKTNIQEGYKGKVRLINLTFAAPAKKD